MRLAAILALAPLASAYWRLQCASRLIDTRADPIITPGKVSGHVHLIAGGNGFGFSMDYDQARDSQCSTCPVKEDLSAYWMPKLFYKDKNGTFSMVPNMGDDRGILGGMNAYYVPNRGPKKEKLVAFPKGLKMVAGNPFKRSPDPSNQGVSFICIDKDGGEKEFDRLPPIKCAGGINAKINFPTCWDGVNLDSPTHTTHVSYPVDDVCPESHPVRFTLLLLETIFDTGDFEWADPDQQPFLFAQGDGTGHGFHGDFVNGWDVPVLQKAIDNCLSQSGFATDCPYFTFYTFTQQHMCKMPNVLKRKFVAGKPLERLPGCNKLTYGPEDAVPATDCKRVPKVVGVKQQPDLSALGWKYIGCAAESAQLRTMSGGARRDSNTTSPESCVKFCADEGFKYSGTMYGSSCQCDDTLRNEPTPGWLGTCNNDCRGQPGVECGGLWAISLYERCSSSNCANELITISGGLPAE